MDKASFVANTLTKRVWFTLVCLKFVRYGVVELEGICCLFSYFLFVCIVIICQLSFVCPPLTYMSNVVVTVDIGACGWGDVGCTTK